MNLTVNHADLSKVLTLLGRTVSTRHSSTSPSSTMAININPGSVIFETTDGETHIRATIPAICDFEHQFFLPGRYFADIIGKLNDGDINMIFDDQKNEMLLNWRSTEICINGWPPSPMPQQVDTNEGLVLSIKDADLRAAIARVASAAATDETRPVLTGILLEVTNGQLALVATDGFRLTYDRCPVTISGSADTSTTIILPSRAASLLTHSLTSSDQEVLITIQEKVAVFHLQNIYFSSTLLSGTFPNYEQVIPPSMPISFSCSRADLTAAVDRASTVSIDNNTAITLSFNNNVLQVSARNTERGNINETIPYEGNNEPLTISFNARLLLPGIKACTTDTVIIDAISPTQMIRLRNNDTSPFFYIVLPLRQAT